MKKFILAIVMVAMVALNLQADTHEKVQLWEGGPYWATTNIGADNPWDYGLYFWWGDTIGYKLKDNANAWVASNGSDYIQLCSGATYGKSIATLQSEGWVSTDGVLALEHDAAHVQWGGSWRMPTAQELADLNNKCNWIWSIKNGVKGYVVRGKGDYASASIFLPAAGIYENVSGLTLVDSNGYYWSSVPSSAEYSVEMVFRSGWRSSSGTCYRDWFLSIRPVQDFHAEPVVSFNANGGTGAMELQTFEEGKEQKLSKNTYCKDGYVFQGWAVTANGEVVYKDEALITVDSDMTLYAVWDNPPLTLTPESANWSSGSITLKCEDSDTSGAEHSYSLEYKENDAWVPVNDEAATNISVSADGFAHLTDNTFWSRLGGIPPVEYRVKDENGRVSAGCVTRNRHGLFVGVGEYENGDERGLARLSSAASDASKFKDIAEKYAKFNGPLYANQDATIDAVDAALDNLVDNSQCGDICLFYVTTHGGYDGNDGLICLYDEDYTHSALTEKVSRMANKGIAFVAVVGTCHAEAMLQMDFPNAAVVAAATMETSSTATFDKIFMADGWDEGCAATGSTMTLANLADYAIEKYNGLLGGIDFLDEKSEECYMYRMSATKNDVGGLLGRIVARLDCASGSNIANKPSGATGFSASTNNSSRIIVSWNAVQGAGRYYLFYGRLGNPQFLGYKEIPVGTSYTFGIEEDWVKESSKAAPVRFMIKAYNAAGAGPAAVTSGWQYKTFPILFYTIDHERVEWDEPSFDQYKDDEVVKYIEYGDEYRLKCLPKANKPGCYLKGWYDLNGNEAIVGLTLSSDAMYHAEWREIAMSQTWLDEHIDIVERSGGDLTKAAAMMAANGARTVDECYRLGINPEDPNDDLKISHFEIKDGKPVITLNHTEDGSGNSFMPRVKTLGKANLSDAEWREVPESGDPTMRFFKVSVELP